MRPNRQSVNCGKKRTPVQIALAWVLSQLGIVCALTGCSAIPHLKENIEGSGWSVSSEHRKELEELFKKEDKWLEKEHLFALKQILSHELPHEFLRAFTDLIYAMETIMLLELVEEKEDSGSALRTLKIQSVILYPTNRYNLRCVMCFNKYNLKSLQESTNELTTEEFKDFLDQVLPFLADEGTNVELLRILSYFLVNIGYGGLGLTYCKKSYQKLYCSQFTSKKDIKVLYIDWN
jgi:hypothetical protein